MKLYGILLEESKEQKCLVEMTREEVATLMMMVNTACLYDEARGRELCANEDKEVWTMLFDIKYSKLW